VNETDGSIRRTFGHAWIALGLALAVHVVDEAIHDFLALYNPTALSIRERLGVPFPPTFSFTSWITGLTVVVVAWLALTPLAYRGRRWLIPLATVLSVIHIVNGLAHGLTSLWLGRPAPGVWSAPLLVTSAIWMLTVVRRMRHHQSAPPPDIAIRPT
jgi:hypothetical protein